jgi:diaminopimelate decarboxylase
VKHTFERPPGFVYSAQKKRVPRGSGKADKATASRQLNCEQVPLNELAERFGTPLYVYSATSIRQRVRAFARAFRGVSHICYSIKANSNVNILRLLSRMGCGFDVVSGGELERVLRTDKSAARRVVFSGVGKTAPEIEAALKAGILLFNLESPAEMEVVAVCAEKLKRTARVAWRVNPDVPAETHPYISTGLRKHKFGVPIGEARRLYAEAAHSKYLQVAGVSVHIGSQITQFAPFRAAMERVAQLVRQLQSDGHRIQYVDVGGGLGISYDGPQDFPSVIAEYADAVTRPLRELKVKVLLEPGRSIIGPAGALLTRVLYRKTNADKQFVVVDGAMNDLIRPALYQAEHQIVPVQDTKAAPEIVDIVGPVCESGDFFAHDRTLPNVDAGDVLAILDAGAYGMALASNYNTRSRPAEVLVDGKSVKLIRRRETVVDQMQPEILRKASSAPGSPAAHTAMNDPNR